MNPPQITWYVTTRRTGIPYHLPGAEGFTLCGRSTRTGLWLDANSLMHLAAVPCQQCQIKGRERMGGE